MGQPAESPAIAALREQVARLEGEPTRNRATLPFGVPAIDKALPEEGWRSGRCMRLLVAATGRSMVRRLRSLPPA